MKLKSAVRWLAVLGAVLSTAAQAAVVYQNLGTVAPPATMGGFAMLAFQTAPQAALANASTTTTIPGSPVPGALTTSVAVTKRTIPGGGWSTWSHGYTGPAFETAGNTITLTLPAGAHAFYFYAEPNAFNALTITATTNSGTTSGPVVVNGNAGATGFGFYSNAGETISTITVTTSDTHFAMAEFGIEGVPLPPAVIPTLSEWGMIALMLLMAGAAALAMKKGRKRL